jgi:hypothetical protein
MINVIQVKFGAFYMKNFILVLAALSTFLSASVSAIIIDYSSYTIDSYSVQDASGTASVTTGGATLELTGNVWKSIALDYTVTSDTLLVFEFFSDIEGEIQHIGFDNNDTLSSDLAFQLFGIQSHFGYQNFHNYTLADGWSSFSIDVGAFYTGTFDRLFFAVDEDRPGKTTANSYFRNVEVCENGSCSPRGVTELPAPQTLTIFGIGLLLLNLRKKLV